MRRKIVSLLAAMVMGGGLGIVAAGGPAQAYAGCRAGHFCVWKGPGGTGSVWNIAESEIANLGCRTFATTQWDNETESWQNRTSTYVVLHKSYNCEFPSGGFFTLNPGQADTAGHRPGFANTISSIG